MSKPEHVRQSLDWRNAEVPVALWEELKEARLLRRDAPTD